MAMQKINLPEALPLKNLSENGTLPWKPDDKKTLAVVIGRIFDLQKQFGKTTGQIENIIEGFCWAMQRYPVERVIWGFSEYILKNSDMPTPADIVKIIDPKPPEWKPDKPYYISLKEIQKNDGKYGLNDEEIEYIQRYEVYAQNERKLSA